MNIKFFSLDLSIESLFSLLLLPVLNSRLRLENGSRDVACILGSQDEDRTGIQLVVTIRIMRKAHVVLTTLMKVLFEPPLHSYDFGFFIQKVIFWMAMPLALKIR